MLCGCRCLQRRAKRIIPDRLLLALLAGCLLGLLWAVLAGGKRGTAMPFGPFLAAGAILTACFGGPVLEWYFGLF